MKTLGELILTDFDAASPILEAWVRGEPLEVYAGCGSWTAKQHGLATSAVYRIPSRPHTVDWSQVGERIVAFETRNGGHRAVDAVGRDWPADLWPRFRPGTMPWQESRIERPKEVK